MKMYLIGFISFLSLSASADYFNLNVHRAQGADGKPYFCYSPLESLGKVKCLNIVAKPALEIPTGTPGQTYKFTHLSIEEISLGKGDEASASGKSPSKDKASEQTNNTSALEVTLAWKSKGAGLLSIDGPEGTLLVFGKVIKDLKNKETPYQVVIENFADSGMSEQFDRANAFGIQNEKDFLMLELRTHTWLEQVLRPVLEKYFKDKAIELVVEPSPDIPPRMP